LIKEDKNKFSAVFFFMKTLDPYQDHDRDPDQDSLEMLHPDSDPALVGDRL
jgi:hypothetical protein